MTTYGIDRYGAALYGTSGQQSYFSADPMVAEQRGYGALQISWATPYQASGSVPPAWSRLRLVRNSWGVPDTEDNGWICLDQAAGNTDPTLGISNSFLDNSVIPGRFYYYALFVASGINTYSSTQVYQPGDYTVNAGLNYICLAVNTVGVTPGSNALIWATTPVTTPWYRCGSGVVGLAVTDNQYRPMLYDLVPRPYKVATVETTATSIPVNDDLFNFTSIFGWGLDVMKSENDALLRMNDIEQCTDRQLGLIAQQMGIDDRLPGRPELRRTFVRDADSIARQAGSADALAQLVTDMSGWQTTATTGYNQLPTQDSAAFVSTVAQPWNPAVYYQAGFGGNQFGDIVTYNAGVYFAYGGAYIYPYYALGGTTVAGGGALVNIPDPQARLDGGYIRVQGAVVGTTLTLPVSLTGGLVGTQYNLYIVLVKDPSGGQVSATVNGTPVAGWSQDTYAPTRQLAQVVFVTTVTTTSNISLVLTVTGKHPLSTGHDVFVAHAVLQSSTTSAPQNLGIPPTGAANSSLYWNQSNLPSYLDTDTERNWLTDGQGIWNIQFASGVVNPRPDNAQGGGVPQGTWGVFPLGAAAASNSPGPGNALQYSTYSAATVGKNTIFTAGEVQAVAWSATVAYNAGQPVTYTLPYAGAVYTARTYTLGDNPATSPTKWALRTLKNATMPEPSLVQNQGIPIKHPAAWVASTAYAKGAIVHRRDTLYQAAQPVPPGVAPTGYRTDNLWWRWVGTNRDQYTLSVYHYRTATGTGQYVRPRIDWFDEFGTSLGFADSYTGLQQVFDHFDTDGATFPQSTVATPPTGWSTPVAWQQGTGIPWVATYGTFEQVDGVVHGNGWNTPTGTTTMTQQMQAGRVLWFDRQWLYGGSTPLDTVQATFVSPPFDASNTMEHGLYFRGGQAGYFFAGRDRLCSTALTYTSGFLSGIANTVIATWTALPDGARIKANVTSTSMSIFARSNLAQGEVLLTNNSLTTFNTQTRYGLLERIRL